ncbi:MAG: pilin [Proteobacteria bacterium]|jgi:prepilin-type N-terminal cleavage/methylation domain-containing protein|nr:pilin [Pseudomonadota bacterium]
MKLRHAFTLIELMMVIAIIGILSTVGFPAYREYVINAKIAEGYVGVEAIRKAQISFFYNRGTFYHVADSALFKSGGSKYALADVGYTSEMIETSLMLWGFFGNPINTGDGYNYFAYISNAGFYDQSGSAFLSNYNVTANTPVFSIDSSPNTRIDFRSSNTPARCRPIIPKTDLGILGTPNSHWAFTIAAVDFKTTDTTTCTLLFQTVQSTGEIRSSPIVVMNRGQ